MPRSPHDTGPQEAAGVQAAQGRPAAPRLVLASQSPRRRELLSMLRLPFEVRPADIEERALPNESSADMAARLAYEKAAAVARDEPDAIVIGSDTIVVVDDAVLGKPADADEAVQMLLRLAGRSHRVETGVAVVMPDGRACRSVEDVDVTLRAFDEEFARAYVATGEPLDKAGAYGIQGLGAALVARIDGDFFAVMGLPVHRLLAHLESFGWCYRFQGLTQCKPSSP